MSPVVSTDEPWPRGRARDGGIDRIPTPVGGLWLAGKHAVGPDPESALTRAGAADLLVCLTERHELVDRYGPYVEWLDRHLGSRARWWPVPDLHAPPLAEARRSVEIVVDHLQGHGGVLVHCAAGIGRAGTFATCVLLEFGLDLSRALDTVAAHRPMAGPEVGAQRRLVESYAAARSAPST